MTFCNLMAKIGRTLRLVVCKVLVSGTIQVFIPNAVTNCVQNDALKTMILANRPILSVTSRQRRKYFLRQVHVSVD